MKIGVKLTTLQGESSILTIFGVQKSLGRDAATTPPQHPCSGRVGGAAFNYQPSDTVDIILSLPPPLGTFGHLKKGWGA